MTITVIGLPGPQGSKRFVGMRGGKGVMIESSRKVKPWREAVKWAAREAMQPQGHGHVEGLDGAIGPIAVQMTFTLPRPKSAPKSRKHADRKPDLSKLVRSTEDALTDAGAWEDDARVVSCYARKTFPGQGPDALDVPGCVIHIRSAQ